MTLHRPTSRHLGVSLLLAAVCATLTAIAHQSTTEKPKTTPKASVRKTEPARNPTRLVLHDDGRKVVGWVSGTTVLSGKVVRINIAGEKATQEVKLDKNNSFAWNYNVEKPTIVDFSMKIEGNKPAALQDSLTVSKVLEESPSVFFVVDRTAYRPTQTLHYAGFLRKMNSSGEFTPLANREVEVELVSDKKQTRAFKVKTTSDSFGRIVGSYSFRDDALDHYTLGVPGYKGSARILLGEYRKSKIKLDIKGALEDDKLKLTFAIRDFLEKLVPGTKASFTAQVVRRDGKSKSTTLKAEDFVHHVPLTGLLNQWDNLPEEQMLLWQAEGAGAAAFLSTGHSAVVAQLSGDVDMKGKETGTYSIDLKKEWLAGNHSIVVSGVVTDTNGREQRATKSIPIGEGTCPGVTLSLEQKTFTTTEKVVVQAKRAGKEAKEHAYDGPLTLVVMKLSPGSPASVPAWNPYGGYYGYNNFSYSLRYYRSRQYGYWNAPTTAETVKRTMVTAVPFGKKDTATVKITEPGAYKLVAIGQREEGTTVRTEIGCLVRAAEDLPALTLHLDKDEFPAGERLTGLIKSKFSNARVLLTLRDSTGLKLWKPLTLGKDGTFVLKESLPEDLRYGCSVEVQYANERSKVVIADRFIRIVPKDRILTITPTVKPTVGPGEVVKIGLQVDRKEEVDLVVSVYDQSLLGIAPDKFVDVKNFYLADERVRAGHARDVLRRRVGNVTVEALAKKAKALLAADKKLAQTPEGQNLQVFVNNIAGRYVYAADISTALRLAGVDVLLHNGQLWYYAQNWHHYLGADTKSTHSLLDLLEARQNSWYLAYHIVNNGVVLYETHPNYANLPLVSRGYNPYLNLLSSGGYGQHYFLQAGVQTWDQRLLVPGFMDGSVSGNSFHSVEGQGFVSHLPVGGVQSPELIATDSSEAHIGVRRDFSDSAFWNAKVRTDKSGKAEVSFKMPDSLTNWQVVVTAISPKMHVGQAKASFRTFKPIMVWPMLPRVFTEGDKVELFGIVHNRSDSEQKIKVKLKVENGEILTAAEKEVTVKSMGNAPVYWTFKALKPGFTQLLMTADCPAGNDASLKRLPVSRAAAEQIVTASGVVKDGARFTIPKDTDMKSASLEVGFAPSLAADMADTLNYLVDYPYGCVEQTMSRFLPAIKVAQVLKNFQVAHPELQKKLPGCVMGGIKRLLELQQPDGGWGWHGNGQTHEMMTPYALYGLLQAEKAGYQIPATGAVERGLARLAQFINIMKEPQTADRIYCMHVYAHRHDLQKPWWDFISAQLEKDKLSHYALALALETAVQKGKKELANDLAKALRQKVKKAGSHRYWETAGFSRWGDDRFEVTAAAMKALVAYDKNDPLIDGILGFFAATKRGDRWNSTKDTAMILYAMCDYLAKERFDPKAKPALSFSINDGEFGKVTFDNKLTKKLVFPATGLKEGKNKLTFKTLTTGMMYRVVFRYWKKGADIKPMAEGITVVRNFYLLDGKGGVKRQLKNGDSVPRGSYVLSEVIATNSLPVAMRYVLVENPKPACGEIIPVEDVRFTSNQGSTGYVLREERTEKVVFHHEQTAQQLNDRCVLLLELAGDYVVPPAHVEMMYRTECRGHSGSFALKVVEEKK